MGSLHYRIVADSRFGIGVVTGQAASPDSIVAGAFEPDRWVGIAGYEDDFLGIDVPIPLPAQGTGDIHPVSSGGFRLDYTHFSVVMSGSRRLAIVAAVNVDGTALVDRERGGESWRLDPRIDGAAQIDNAAYRDNDFDRGHLVRRIAPVWGSSEDAERANHDTFHYTNCAPQHKALNQRTWLDLERHLLRKTQEHETKASIFTGPVFRPDDLLYRGEYLIPAEYWKLAIANDGGKLVGAAYLQTQRNLVGPVTASPFGDYKTYRVPIAMISQVAALDLGPIGQIDPPQSMLAARQSIQVISSPEGAGFLD